MRLQGALLAIALTAACQQTPAARPPEDTAKRSGPATPDWKTAIKHTVRYDPARSSVVVDVTVAPGFHAYTVGEEIGRPMKVTIDEESGLELEGEIHYPKGKTKSLSTGRSVIVEGHAEIVARVKSRSGVDVNGQKARGKFHYQVCTDEACDRPRSAAFDVAAGGS